MSACAQGRGSRILAREGVDSPQETRLRLLVVLAGLLLCERRRALPGAPREQSKTSHVST